MNNIEQMIANAQNNATQATQETTQQETQVTQQAAGQDFQQNNQAAQAQTAQQANPQATQAQANPQVVNQAETYTQQQANPQAVNTQQTQQTQQANTQQATQQANPQASAIPAHIQQQAQQANTAPQQANPAPMAVNPMGNTGMDVPANLPPELAKFIGQREMSMDTMSNSDLLVQDWVKPDYHGMTLGSAPQVLLNPIQVEIDMTENVGYMLCQMVRWTVTGATGDQTNYIHTYDGVTGSDGQPWANSVMTAYNTTTDPKKPVVPFPSVQLPMKLMHDINGPDGNPIAQAGIMLGHTTAKTGWQNWQNFHNTVKQAGLLGQTVIVEVSNQPVAPKGISYKWGTLEFKLIGPSQGQIAAQ